MINAISDNNNDDNASVIRDFYHILLNMVFLIQDVESILLDGSGRACGVRTTDGREVAAKLVLSNATPHVTFFKLLPSGVLSQHYEKCLRSIDYSSGVAKINGKFF